MFGLNPFPMYAIIFLIFSNACTFLFWQFADSKADKYEAKLATCAAEHKASIAQIDAMGRIAKEQAKAKEAEDAKIADETATGWAAALGVVRAGAAQRMRDESRRSAGGGGLSAPGKDTSGHAEASTDPIPSPARIAEDCAETTVTANFLQSYIERLQHE